MSNLQIMIRCPVTGRPVFTGVVVEHEADVGASAHDHAVGCPHCDDLHQWGPQDAWFRPEQVLAAGE